MNRRFSTLHLATMTLAVAALTLVGCEKVPLLAPTGSSITLTTATNTLSANGTATIIAQVLEAAGTPPHSGTRVTFLTTLGVVDPAEASTDASGRVMVTFRPNGASGVAEISANSGGATTSAGTTSGTSSGAGSTGGTTTTTTGRNLTIYVGSAAVGRVLISANPVVLPTTGGTTTLTANVLDRNGNPLAGTPVSFTTTAGTLSANVANTDSAGNSVVTLNVFQAATVTATVGVSSSTGGNSGGTTGGGTSSGSTGTSANQASVTVSLTSAPTVQITPPTNPPAAGLPGLFTLKVTPATSGGGSGGTGSGSGGSSGSAGTPIPISRVIIDWGDGARDDAGSVSGEQIVAHTWRQAGTYPVAVTVTDVAGGSARVTTSVVVTAVPRPTVIVTPNPPSGPSGTQINFSIQITVPSGLTISNVVIDFGDNTTQALGGATGVISVPHLYPSGPSGVRTYSVFVTVTDGTGVSTTGSTTVSITS